MRLPIEQLVSDNCDWQHLCQKIKSTDTLTAIVLTAWQMGLWIARLMVEQQLAERAHLTPQWNPCLVCGTQLVSKGFVNRQMLTLIGTVKWKRRL